MNSRSFLLGALVATLAGVLLVCPRPAEAFIDVPPQTLGDMCRQSSHIYVLKVDKVSAERGVILFKTAEQLKGKGDPPLPDDTFTKVVVGQNVNGSKVILDWAVEGKTAVVFAKDFGIKSVAHLYIDGYWYLIAWNPNGNYWAAARGEPTVLVRYCGAADKLGDAVTKILKGEEVVVPAMTSEDRKALLEARGKVQDIQASLKILGNPKQNIDAELKAGLADDKKPEAKPGTKPGDVKPGEKKSNLSPTLSGKVKAVAADGKSFTLLIPPTEKNKEATTLEVQLTDRTKFVTNDGSKLAVGQAVSVWLDKGDAKTAVAVQIGKPPEKPPVKPVPGEKPGKPNPDEKPEAPKKPKPPAGPVRDPKPTATIIDTEIDKQLAQLKITAASQADDAEFLRRVTLDLTGRIPTYQQTVAFLDSKDPDKRRKLIDELLDSAEYGQHFATGWRNLLPRELNVTGKGGVQSDAFGPWLAEQFNDNRGWDGIVTDLLTAEGNLRDNPATIFLLTNGENGQPRANKAAASVAGLFLGVNLRCAECHNHPFAQWKQTDFWGIAAFFGKLQYSGGGKDGQSGLMESLTGGGSGKEKGQAAPMLRGTAIVIPGSSGKAAGQTVNARFLGGAEPNLDEKEPFRPTFAKWATAADNPYFAKAAVNRMWAHFFGRGFVNPLDSFDTNSPTHPELLDRLAKEFAASGFDLKHLARCITMSKAYQRSSRPPEGSKGDPVAFSYMAVKVLTPEALFDSLEIIGKSTGNSGNTEKGKGVKQESRELFLRSFRTDEEATATQYIQGIPEMLRLMNASTPNRGAAVVDQLISSGASHAEAVTTLYLTVLSRRPTDDELKLMESYLSKRKDDREGYRGVLWILLNTSEFALNH